MIIFFACCLACDNSAVACHRNVKMEYRRVKMATSEVQETSRDFD